MRKPLLVHFFVSRIHIFFYKQGNAIPHIGEMVSSKVEGCHNYRFYPTLYLYIQQVQHHLVIHDYPTVSHIYKSFLPSYHLVNIPSFVQISTVPGNFPNFPCALLTTVSASCIVIPVFLPSIITVEAPCSNPSVNLFTGVFKLVPVNVFNKSFTTAFHLSSAYSGFLLNFL